MMQIEVSASDPVAVLGMHRSGTSAVSRLLSALGLEFGEPQSLIAPSPDNPLGYFEHEKLTNLNAGILALLGTSWSAPPALESGWWKHHHSNSLDAVLEEGRALITAQIECAARWGWKDPRNCLLLPLWEDLTGRTFDLVFVYRHPLEVAQSLAQRDQLPESVALALWEHYNRQALINMAGHRVAVLSYQLLLESPQATADALRKHLQLAADLQFDAPRFSGQPIIAPELRRSKAGDSQSELTPAQAALYAELQKLPAFSASFSTPSLPPSAYSSELDPARRIAGASLSFMQRRLEAESLALRELSARFDGLSSSYQELRSELSKQRAEHEHYRTIIEGPSFRLYNRCGNLFKRSPQLHNFLRSLLVLLMRKRH